MFLLIPPQAYGPGFSFQVIGEWDEVLNVCRKGHLQPQVLFYESVN